MGVAFYAVREAPDGVTPAVLKVVKPDIVGTAGPTAMLMIQKEAIALGRLNERVPPTPFVVRFMDTGTVVLAKLGNVELPWIAVEYVHGGVEGTTLDQRVRYSVHNTRYAFDATRAERTVECLAEGLVAIHDVGVVHRDLTPGNVLCCGFGANEVPKIADSELRARREFTPRSLVLPVSGLRRTRAIVLQRGRRRSVDGRLQLRVFDLLRTDRRALFRHEQLRQGAASGPRNQAPQHPRLLGTQPGAPGSSDRVPGDRSDNNPRHHRESGASPPGRRGPRAEHLAPLARRERSSKPAREREARREHGRAGHLRRASRSPYAILRVTIASFARDGDGHRLR